MNALERAQVVHKVIRENQGTEGISFAEVQAQLPNMRNSHMFDALAKLHRDHVIERLPPAADRLGGARRYRAVVINHTDYYPEG